MSRSNSRELHTQIPHRSRSVSRSGSYLKSPVRSVSKSPINRRPSPRRYSNSRSPAFRKKYDRSYSPSPNMNRRGGRRSRSRSSPPPPRRGGGRGGGRHFGNRENPSPSSCIGVFGLSKQTDNKDLERFFDKYGEIRNINLVMDKYTNQSLGYAFIYYHDIESAKAAKEDGTGAEIDGKQIRIDYSITKKAHTPTPGVYMGKRPSKRRDRYDSRENSREYRGGRGGRDYDRRRPPPRSRSPYGYSRSRSGGRRSSSRSFGGYVRRDR